MEFDDIYPKHKKFIQWCIQKYPGLADFQDVEQDVLMKLYKNRLYVRNPHAIKAFIYRVVQNYFTDILRKGKLETISMSELEFENEDLKESYIEKYLRVERTPEDDCVSKLMLVNVIETLNKLDDIWGQVLFLREVEQYSYDEIANILNINLGTVKSRIARGRGYFKEMYVKTTEDGV